MHERWHPADFAFGIALSFIWGIAIASFNLPMPMIVIPSLVATASSITMGRGSLAEIITLLVTTVGGIFYFNHYAPRTFPTLPIQASFASLKRIFIANIYTALPDDQAALLAGILFGDKTSLPATLKTDLGASGVSHLVAVSGYNISIILLTVRQVLGRFLNRRRTFWGAIIFLGAFMLMIGVQISAIRASVMAVFTLVAREIGEPFQMRNPLVFCAVAMLLINPTLMAQNIGFVLSFSAIIGIVYLRPALVSLFTIETRGWKDAATTSLSAELMILPIVSAAFGNPSALSIAANLLILPTVPLAMLLGAMVIATKWAAPLVGPILIYQLFIIHAIANAGIPIPLKFNRAAILVLYYGIVAALIIYSHIRKRG